MKTPRWALVAVLAVLFAVVPAGGVLAGGPPIAPPGLEQAIAAQEAHTDALLARQGVVGTGVGVGADGRAVVKIYSESGRVAGLPKRLDSVPVEVEVTGEIVAQTTFTRPVPIGVSSGTERLIVYRGWLYCTVGTLGAWVKDIGGTVYALSNAHVYALQGSKPYGTVQTGSSGDRILQPGRVDMTAQACGSQAEISDAVIGNLWKYVPIVFSKTANNTVDAAIATLTTTNITNATPSDGYGTPSSTPVAASLGQAVQKYGRTTGLTTGTVTGVNATVLIRYDIGFARFVKQVVVQGTSGSFSAGGDSGSLIVTDDGVNSPVALLFAGSSSSTIGNPIGLVLGALGVSIDGVP
ncbi:MAG: hypothetical protein HY002_14510 [Candidatus Rokubacteria bacterium]|nr:hypothetical protein [Candidatus Rokubacteria bacterium]